MPRRARRDLESCYLHVIVQGIERKYIFDKECYKEKYKELMLHKSQVFNVKILAYCIMGNHTHSLLFSENIEEIGKYMKSLNTAYAHFYNKSEKRVGYVFRDRYLSEAIRSERQLYNCLVYIHYNPVEAKIVSLPDKYRYSSYIDYQKNKGIVDEFVPIGKGLKKKERRIIMVDQEIFKEKIGILETLLRNKFFKGDESVDFATMLIQLKNKKFFARFYEPITIARKIRNVLTHNKTKDCKSILAVSDEIMNSVDSLIKLIEQPTKAVDSSMTIKAKDIFSQNIDDRIYDAIKVMNEKIYTHIPIYEGKNLVGVFSENVFFNIMLKEEEILLDKDVTFTAIKSYLDVESHTGEEFLFVDRNKSILEIEEYFENYFARNERLAVVYITNSGKKTEQILGMITPWDILGNDEATEM